MIRRIAALHAFGNIIRAFSVVRAPLLVALFAAITLSLPAQARELLRVLGQDYSTEGLRACSGFFFLALASLSFWRIAYDLAQTNGCYLPSQLAREVLAWLPLLCGVALPIGLTLGIYWAAEEISLPPLPAASLRELGLEVYAQAAAATAPHLKLGAAFVAAFGVVVAVLAAFNRPDVHLHVPIPIHDWDILGRKARILILIGLAGLVACYALFPVRVPQAVGSIAIFLQFVTLLAFSAGLITLLFDQFRIPAIACLILLAVLVSVFDLDDNHVVKPFKMTEGSLEGADDAFSKWYESRKDRAEYDAQGKRYPVILVAAAGGGMYAAYHTAIVLARLQDRCPNFAQHVFAISGVSGGSLGAAVFTGLAKIFAENGPRKDCTFGEMKSGPFEEKTRRILSKDLLSPVVASGLFPDFLQRFLPLPINLFDRSRAFDSAIEDAWGQALPEAANPFANAFLEHWKPSESRRAAPALILNTTDVAHGSRVTIAPFQVGVLGGGPIAGFFSRAFRPISGTADFYELFRGEKGFGDRAPIGYDIKLSTAVGLSARYPWILPPGTIEAPKGSGRSYYKRIVDGGYHENSGMESALDVLLQLRHKLDPKKIRPIIIVINSYEEEEPAVWQGANEVLAPIRTMLSTMQQRGYRAIYQSFLRHSELDPGDYDLSGWNAFVLNHKDFRLPLGWQLTETTRTLIAEHSGLPHKVDYRGGWAIGRLANVVSPDKRERIAAFLSVGANSSCETISVLHPTPRGNRGCKE